MSPKIIAKQEIPEDAVLEDGKLIIWVDDQNIKYYVADGLCVKPLPIYKGVIESFRITAMVELSKGVKPLANPVTRFYYNEEKGRKSREKNKRAKQSA